MSDRFFWFGLIFWSFSKSFLNEDWDVDLVFVVILVDVLVLVSIVVFVAVIVILVEIIVDTGNVTNSASDLFGDKAKLNFCIYEI